MTDEPGSPFGLRLRQWRQRRGLGQLALAGLVGSTSRYISFLETGRSRPSRQMVLRLAATLDVGLRESNQLLHAAGLNASYRETTIDDAGWLPTGGPSTGSSPRTTRTPRWSSMDTGT